jgi:hypothetical protein
MNHNQHFTNHATPNWSQRPQESNEEGKVEEEVILKRCYF